MFRVLVLVALVVLGGLQTAHAHFVWVDVVDSRGGRDVRVYFSEAPAPGEPHLIEKIAHAKAWSVSGDGAPRQLSLVAKTSDEAPSLTAACPAGEVQAVEVACEYGLFAPGPKTVLLHYYAKHLAGNWSAGKQPAGESHLACDIIPSIDGERLLLNVLFRGKPQAGSEVVVLDPSGETHNLKSDAQGRVALPLAASGRYSVRAAHIEADLGGQRDEQKYEQTWHYATLTFDAPAVRGATGEPTAAELLTRARDARAMWNDFPGFTADLVATGDDQHARGQMTIDADGIVSLDMPESPLAEWVGEQLRSMVQHRMPDGEVSTVKVTYPDNDRSHPLGRKIDLGDPVLESAYRIKDDVILEVNRLQGDMRFTISVLEIVRNPEGKYLPRAFAMNFFDATSGQLRMALAYLNDWQRVGGFDLPSLIVEVGAARGATTRRLAFQNVKLLEKIGQN